MPGVYYIFFNAISIIKKLDINKFCGIYIGMSKTSDYFISNDYCFQEKGPVYLFSNENVAGAMLCAGNLSGCRVLSVCSSGDYALSAYMSGAQSVDTFDVNSYQYAVTELKWHLIRKVSYSDFKNFFLTRAHFFNERLLQDVRGDFSKGLTEFIDDYVKVRGDNAFISSNIATRVLAADKVPYLFDETAYRSLQDKLCNKINFQHCHLGRVSQNFSGKYDLVYLSNIYDYVVMGRSKSDAFEYFYNVFLQPLADQFLTETGCIIFRYVWGSDAANIVAWQNHFDCHCKNDKYRFSVRGILDVNTNSVNDTVFVLQKKQR